MCCRFINHPARNNSRVLQPDQERGNGNYQPCQRAGHGDIDAIPNNTPHVGCTFTVEWYGFNEGPDIVSTVSFAEHAPTTGVGMTVSGPGQVFVGGDPATGAGTPTGFDGRQVYTLSFTGAPHPQQGYHVKLTIHTPGSIGNDTKSKTFWVRGCNPPTPTPAATPTPEKPAYQYEPTGWFNDTNYGLTRFLGNITDAGGNPVDGVYIQASCGGFSVISNASGTTGWPPGFYDLTLDTKPIPCQWALTVVDTDDKKSVKATLSEPVLIEVTYDKSIVTANWRKNW